MTSRWDRNYNTSILPRDDIERTSKLRGDYKEITWKTNGADIELHRDTIMTRSESNAEYIQTAWKLHRVFYYTSKSIRVCNRPHIENTPTSHEVEHRENIVYNIEIYNDMPPASCAKQRQNNRDRRKLSFLLSFLPSFRPRYVPLSSAQRLPCSVRDRVRRAARHDRCCHDVLGHFQLRDLLHEYSIH